jgi:hypothetical protein
MGTTLTPRFLATYFNGEIVSKGKKKILFIDLQILTTFLYICNKISINNESCRCIEFDAKS